MAFSSLSLHVFHVKLSQHVTEAISDQPDFMRADIYEDIEGQLIQTTKQHRPSMS